MNHYTYRVSWSHPDDMWVGTVVEFKSLSWLADTETEALEGIVKLVSDILDDMATTGEVPPTPLSDRNYSGKVMVRTSPALHARMTMEAAEQGVSVNQWVNQKLCSA